MINFSRWIHVSFLFAGIIIVCGVWTGPSVFAEERAPIVYLSFDENFDDSGPYQLKAVAKGDEVYLRPGKLGKGLFIGGTEDWLEMPMDDRILLGYGFTVELWFRRDDWTNPYKGGSGFQTLAAVTSSITLDILAPGCPMHEPWALQGYISSKYRKDVGESDFVRVYTPGNSVPPNKWMHMALVYDKPDASLTLYLNGVKIDEAFGVPQPGLTYRQIRLGTWHKENQAFRGDLDEFKCYDYPRSSEAVLKAAQTNESP
jgi:hypothetical protein